MNTHVAPDSSQAPVPAPAPPTPPIPDALAAITRASGNSQSRTDTAMFARLVQYFGNRLVIALADSGDPNTPADLFAVDRLGMLSMEEASGLVAATATAYMRHLTDAFADGQVSKADLTTAMTHAARLMDADALAKLRKVAPSAIAFLRAAAALPDWLVVVRQGEIDADLRHVGTPGGVVDLLTGRMLTPDEARRTLTASSTGVHYRPGAVHARLDEILPPISALVEGSIAHYRARVLARALAHAPRREFLWESCAAGSGKSTFVNALAQGLGGAYIRTIRPEALQRSTHANGSAGHNGDLRHLGKPARLAFVQEFSGRVDSSTLKAASGGDVLSMRRIRREDETLRVSAHVWFMSNDAEGADDGPQLGLGADDANGQAHRDRAKVLRRERIEHPDPETVLLDTQDFREAALCRLVEYTTAYGNDAFPDDLPSMTEWAREQAERELPLWQRDWLPRVLIPAPDGLEADSKTVYTSYLVWHEDALGSTQKPVPPAVVGKAVCKHYGITPGPQKRTPLGVSKPYPGHVVHPEYRGLGVTGVMATGATSALGGPGESYFSISPN